MNPMKPSFALATLLVLSGMGWPLRTAAHGVLMDATPIPSFQVHVRYESGEPMANAQVNVYAPTDPQTAWLQTVTDENGYFLFTPDPALMGTWDIQARLAGHGEVLQIDVQEDGSIRQLTPSRGTPVKKGLTIASVVWGFVGTALFFSKRSSKRAEPSESITSP